jgi:hypothetical protein
MAEAELRCASCEHPERWHDPAGSVQLPAGECLNWGCRCQSFKAATAGPSTEKGAALLAYFQDMGENARDVLLLQAERLAIGAHELGDFDDKRDFEAEALQEALDLGNYLARLVIQQKAEIARLTARG